MDWLKQEGLNKNFWHLTTSSAIENIKEKGLFQSKNGQQGKGLYAIEPDYDVLESVISLIQQEKKVSISEISLVEFTYSGSYFINPVDMLIYSSEGWVLIPSDISSEIF